MNKDSAVKNIETICNAALAGGLVKNLQVAAQMLESIIYLKKLADGNQKEIGTKEIGTKGSTIKESKKKS